MTSATSPKNTCGDGGSVACHPGIQAAHFRGERRALEPQHLGGGLLVAAGFLERLFQDAPFDERQSALVVQSSVRHGDYRKSRGYRSSCAYLRQREVRRS